MTCKDCVHYVLCKDKWSYELIPIFATLSGRMQKTYMDGAEDKCQAFKHKSRFVELPCEVGQTLYFLYDNRYANKPDQTPKILETQDWYFDIDKYDISLLPRNVHGYKGVYHYYLNKTVFLSREEAEKALAERRK